MTQIGSPKIPKCFKVGDTVPVKIYKKTLGGVPGQLVLETSCLIKAGPIPGVKTVRFPELSLPFFDEKGDLQEFSVWLVDPLGNEYAYVSVRLDPEG